MSVLSASVALNGKLRNRDLVAARYTDAFLLARGLARRPRAPHGACQSSRLKARANGISL
jgi:hypothetical protein